LHLIAANIAAHLRMRKGKAKLMIGKIFLICAQTGKPGDKPGFLFVESAVVRRILERLVLALRNDNTARFDATLNFEAARRCLVVVGADGRVIAPTGFDVALDLQATSNCLIVLTATSRTMFTTSTSLNVRFDFHKFLSLLFKLAT
jgi:hypothetical protein